VRRAVVRPEAELTERSTSPTLTRGSHGQVLVDSKRLQPSVSRRGGAQRGDPDDCHRIRNASDRL